MILPTTAGRPLLLRRVLQRPNLTSSLSKRPKFTSSDCHRPSNPPPSPPYFDTTPKTIPGPNWFWLEPLTVPFRYYSRAQHRRPYLTQLLSSLTIYFLGDLSAQTLTSPKDEESTYSIPRAVRALVIGGISSIPSYKWFIWLGSQFNFPFSKLLSLATKVLVNQLVFTPIFNSYFFGMQTVLTGGGPVEVMARIKECVPTSWWNSCKLWPAVTAFSFTFVRPQYRSIFAGVIAIGWQTYLSMLNQRAEKAEVVEYVGTQSGVAGTSISA